MASLLSLTDTRLRMLAARLPRVGRDLRRPWRRPWACMLGARAMRTQGAVLLIAVVLLWITAALDRANVIHERVQASLPTRLARARARDVDDAGANSPFRPVRVEVERWVVAPDAAATTVPAPPAVERLTREARGRPGWGAMPSFERGTWSVWVDPPRGPSVRAVLGPGEGWSWVDGAGRPTVDPRTDVSAR